ncbi:MAG: P-II family nitrogen regulator [Acidobacteriia bacterium]|nr:P-II family nitrogen regulator [Terriglobia bacterium]
MKRIEAIIKPNCLEKVKGRLAEIGVEGMTVAELSGMGREKAREFYRGAEYVVEFLPRISLMILAEDKRAPEIIDAIIAGARTGKAGDGKIFVTPVEEVVSIRSGAWNHAAV